MDKVSIRQQINEFRIGVSLCTHALEVLFSFISTCANAIRIAYQATLHTVSACPKCHYFTIVKHNSFTSCTNCGHNS